MLNEIKLEDDGGRIKKDYIKQSKKGLENLEKTLKQDQKELNQKEQFLVTAINSGTKGPFKVT